MASIVDLESEHRLKVWGLRDAERQTEALQHMRRTAGRYEFITKGKKRKVKPVTYSLQEHAITSHVMRLVSRPNAATFLLENVTYASACNDFRRLIGLVNDYPEPGQSDLATLIYPVFVYFYLLLLQSGPYGYRDAQSFFKKNNKIFAQEESYTEILKILRSFRHWADVKLHFYFKNFLECRYIIGLPGEVLYYLKSCMERQAKEEGDKALLYVLHFHIYFQDSDEADYIEKVTGEIPTSLTETEIVYQEDASDYVIENSDDAQEDASDYVIENCDDTQGDVAQMKDAKDDNVIIPDEAIAKDDATQMKDAADDNVIISDEAIAKDDVAQMKDAEDDDIIIVYEGFAKDDAKIGDAKKDDAAKLDEAITKDDATKLDEAITKDDATKLDEAVTKDDATKLNEAITKDDATKLDEAITEDDAKMDETKKGYAIESYKAVTKDNAKMEDARKDHDIEKVEAITKDVEMKDAPKDGAMKLDEAVTIYDAKIGNATVDDAIKEDAEKDDSEKEDTKKEDSDKEDINTDDDVVCRDDVTIINKGAVPEPMDTEPCTQNIENENVQLDEVSYPDYISDVSSSSLPRSSDNDDESSESDEEISDTDLEGLLDKLTLNLPLFSTVVTKYVGSNITCVDFNDDYTEIAYAVGRNFIYTSALRTNVVQTKLPLDEDSDERNPKKKRLEEEKIEIPPSSPPPQIIRATSPVLQRRGGLSHRRKAKYEKASKSARKLKSSKKVPKRIEESSSEVSNLKRIEIPEGDRVYIIKYLPENPDILLAVSNKKVRLLETKSSSFEAEYVGASSILDIDVNSTSKYFASATSDGVAQLYSFIVNTPIQTFVGHESPVTAVKFHPNGIYLATGSKDSLRMFDIDSGLCVRLFFGYNPGINALSFSFDGKWLSCGGSCGTVKVWDIKDGSEIAPEICFSREIETLGRIVSLCFADDSCLLMACNRKGECKLWDARDSRSVQQLNFINIPLKIKCCKDGVWKIAFQETLL